MKKTIAIVLTLLGVLLITSMALAAPNARSLADSPAAPVLQAGQEGCLSCHQGIENIRDPESGMMKQIAAQGECTTCHAGDPTVTGTPDDAEAVAAAHGGADGAFYPDPGSPWVADQTCGKCHVDYNYALIRSLMNTEAGKIQGNLWAWGVQGKYGQGRTVKYGNYTLDDEDGPTPIFGTEAYKQYMEALTAAFPDQFPTHMEKLPVPTVEEIVQDPSLAAFTYQVNQCQRCHVGTPPRSKRGDWRGMGCSSCHVPYSNEGFYEGNDPTIPKDEPGHPLVHEIQGTREARNGIPVETCNSCHNRGKRIGVSYEGIMEFPYGTPFDETGAGQPKLHTKKYLYIADDLHHSRESRPENPEGGMLCQDCHTSIEMHGDGNLPGTTLAQVEIECADCHGTPDAYPWELPLGYNEEAFGMLGSEGRGVTSQLPINQLDGTVYDPEDGYLLTARGNPFGNVVRRGDQVILHSATGRDYFVPVLKDIKQKGTWTSPDAEVAMDKVSAHMDNMECYACHSNWAPQCYGCHVTVDYTEGNAGTDWVAVGNSYREGNPDMSLKTPGKVKEGRAYLRWENPILGVNGEGRVTPLIPGCQVVYTVIGPDGQNVVNNVIGRTPPNEEGGGADGQLGMDMAPAQPHTAGRKARTCESCHNDPKALGYGINGGEYMKGNDQDLYVELVDAEGNLLTDHAQVQMQGIPDLGQDWSQIIDPETGKQLMTVGSHWPGSGPLSEDQRTRMERVGLCMGCHQNMTDTAFWTDKVIATYGQIVTNDDHINLMNQLVHDAVEGQAAIAEVTAAQAEISTLKAQLAEQGSAAQPQQPAVTEEPVNPVTTPSQNPPWLLAAISLIVGIGLGAGAILVARKK